MTTSAAVSEPVARPGLAGMRLGLAWIAYALLAAFLVAVWAPQLPEYIEGLRALPVSQTAARNGLPWDPIWVWLAVIALLDTVISAAVAAFLVWRRPRDGFVLFTSFALLGAGIVHSTARWFGTPSTDVIRYLFLPVSNAGILLLPFLFPDGRFVPRWGAWYWLALFVSTELVAFAVLPIGDALTVNLYGIELILVGSVIAQIQRYRMDASALRRAQTRWFLLGYLAFAVVFQVNISLANFVFFPATFVANPADLGFLAFAVLGTTAQRVAGVAVPIAVLIAVLRWRLFAVDLVINRTFVYGALTAILVTIFAVGSAVMQRVLSAILGGSSDLANVASALIVVGAFLPLRTALRSVADRFLPERAVLAFLFADLVGSTDRVLTLGDERWRALLGQYRSAVRRELRRSGGREVDTTGDGFFLTFRTPAQAVRAAAAIRAAVRQLGLQVRIGIHVGECEVHGSKVSGINVHTAARVMSVAGPSEIVVSSTLRELVAGSELQFSDRGVHQLKGLPNEWRLYAFAGA